MKVSQIGETVTVGSRDFTIGQKMLIQLKDKKLRASLIEVDMEKAKANNMVCQIDETLECVNVMPDNIEPDIEIEFMIKSSDGSNQVVELETKLNEDLIYVIKEEILEALEEDLFDAAKDSADLYVRVYLPYEGGEKDWTEISILEQD